MSDPKLPQPNQETSMEQRLLIAFGLMIVVMIVSTYLMPKQPEADPKSAPAKQSAAIPASPAPAPAPVASSPAKPGLPAGRAPARVVGQKEETATIETALHRVEFSNRGAVARHWVLRNFKDSKNQALELINPKAVEQYGYPLQLRYHEAQTADLLNQALWAMKVSDDKLSVSFEYFDGTWRARKRLRFKNDSYVVDVESEVTAAGSPKPHLLAWRGGFGDFSVVGAAAAQKNVYFETASGLTPKTADTAEKGPQANRGSFDFAGIADSYFAAVALPEGRQFELHTFQDKAANLIDGKEDPFPGMAVGGDAINRFPLFVGPKDTSLLRKISPKLEQLVDFGYFTLLAKPLFLSLKWLHDNYLRNYGWTIVSATVLINLLLMPLKLTSLKSMKQMSAIQPEMKKIQDKFAGMSMKDPRKQQQNEEMMALYKKHGVNPMSGCMPMALQIPFFIAFYNVLANAIELRGASWLWVADLSRPEDAFGDFRILPISMLATQLLMQKMTPSTSVDPAQQRMMLIMPLMLGFMFWGVSSGLVLYWLTGNVVGIAQQWLFNKLGSKPVLVTASSGLKKK